MATIKMSGTAELVRYAKLTAADMGASYDDAVHAMRDEAGYVAEEIGCSVDDVIAFCAEASFRAEERRLNADAYERYRARVEDDADYWYRGAGEIDA